MRWEPHPEFERVVVDLADADGEPASGPGRVEWRVLRNGGVVRIELPDVERVATDATEARFGGPVARAAYAVWSPEGRWVYVDVHLAAAADASVTTLADPARVMVDLRPGDGPDPEPTPEADRVVVLEPRPGGAAYPLRITGYARTFEANVVARLEHEGRDVHEAFTTATAWVDAWGHFELGIEDGPRGRVVLHVGEHSARDGAWEGVAIPLDMR